jgi:hypothetical protein
MAAENNPFEKFFFGENTQIISGCTLDGWLKGSGLNG